MASHQGGPYENDGEWAYGYGYDQQPQQEQPGLKHYDFPSAPTPHEGQHSRPDQQYGQPGQHPQQPYNAPHQQQSQQPQQGAPAARGAKRPQSRLVRPYAMTGGRTRPRYQLAIEALVQTTADPGRLQSQLPEHQRICQLCYEIKSVAEISALLTMPLGVARILVADLAEAGLVTIHQPGAAENASGQPDVTLLERVLSGLRKL
ncbi:DUF742 domain-containing protein [Streptomyces sp. A7024]|uniref:DUF742 domain-containing protein n=1 Tax=Streptomyces coryli TaxID=1128680 RepID=A0A6G4U1I4_9ACTN|nr:DUF742 domain-containing protein [Streptomyces coryli]